MMSKRVFLKTSIVGLFSGILVLSMFLAGFIYDSLIEEEIRPKVYLIHFLLGIIIISVIMVFLFKRLDEKLNLRLYHRFMNSLTENPDNLFEKLSLAIRNGSFRGCMITDEMEKVIVDFKINPVFNEFNKSFMIRIILPENRTLHLNCEITYLCVVRTKADGDILTKDFSYENYQDVEELCHDIRTYLETLIE